MGSTLFGIVGTGGFAKCIYDALRLQTRAAVVFLSREKSNFTELLGEPIAQEESVYSTSQRLSVFVGIGDESIRQRYASLTQQTWPHVSFPALVHPTAKVASTATIGDGVIVLAGAIVEANSTLEPFCAVCTGATIGQNTRIGAYSTIAPGATVSRNVVIGSRSFVGLQAYIGSYSGIGNDVIVGAKSAVTGIIPDCVVVVGQPARIVRHRSRGVRGF